MVEIFKAKIFLTLNVLNEIIWSTEGQGYKQFFSLDISSLHRWVILK